MAHMFCLKFTVSEKEDVQSSVRRISFKEHKSVSHNKAVKKTNTWGKFLATVSLQASWRWSPKHLLSDTFVCLQPSMKLCLACFWCLNKGSHSHILILIFGTHLINSEFFSIWRRWEWDAVTFLNPASPGSFICNFFFHPFSSSVSFHIYYGSKRKSGDTFVFLETSMTTSQSWSDICLIFHIAACDSVAKLSVLSNKGPLSFHFQ